MKNTILNGLAFLLTLGLLTGCGLSGDKETGTFYP